MGENLSTSHFNLNEDQATYLITLFRNTPTVLGVVRDWEHLKELIEKV